MGGGAGVNRAPRLAPTPQTGSIDGTPPPPTHTGLGLGTIYYFNFQKGSRPLDHLTKKKNQTQHNTMFSGVPKQGDKISSDYISPTFLGAQKWVELLRNPCILGVPQKRGQNQTWLHHPCLLGGPKVSGIAV